eukprot:3931970-Rhodomonas_salina.1
MWRDDDSLIQVSRRQLNQASDFPVPSLSKAYSTTKDNLKKQLDDLGIAVIEDVFSTAEITLAEKGMWSTFEKMTSKWKAPIQFDRASSWDQFKAFNPRDGYIFDRNGIQHSKFMWDIRGQHKVRSLFAEGLGALGGMATSFEPLYFHWSLHKKASPIKLFCNDKFDGTNKLWQNSFGGTSSNFLQGMVPLYNMSVSSFSNNMTLVFFEGSHLFLDEFVKEFRPGVNTGAHYRLTKNEEFNFFVDKKCKFVALQALAGSLVLWNPKLIHGMAFASDVRKDDSYASRPFAAVPISMAEKRMINSRNSRCYDEMYDERRGGTHYPLSTRKTPFLSGGDVEFEKPETYARKMDLPGVGRELFGEYMHGQYTPAKGNVFGF